MAKIDKVNSGDTGLSSRNKINEALKDIKDEPLSSLMDVTISSPIDADVLSYNNGSWINVPISFDATNKADKVIGATSGNFAGLNALGNLTDSGVNMFMFASSSQGALADSALQPGDNISELNNDKGYLTDVDISTYLENIVEDITPQLGGNLDTQGFEIGNSIGDLVLNPGDNNVVISGTGTNYISTDGTTNLEIVPGGLLILDGLRWPDSDGTLGQVLTTDGMGKLSFTSVSGASPVNSVFGRSGDIAAQESDYVSFYATTAQGALADSALQSLNNESINSLSDVNTTGVTNSQVLMWDGNTFTSSDVVDPDDYLGKGIPTTEIPNPNDPAETGNVKNITDIVNHLFMFASNGKKVIIDAGKTVSLPMEDDMTFDEIARVILSIDSVSFTITGTSTNTVWTDLITVDVISDAFSIIANSNAHQGSSVVAIDAIHEISTPSSSASAELI